MFEDMLLPDQGRGRELDTRGSYKVQKRTWDAIPPRPLTIRIDSLIGCEELIIALALSQDDKGKMLNIHFSNREINRLLPMEAHTIHYRCTNFVSHTSVLNYSKEEMTWGPLVISNSINLNFDLFNDNYLFYLEAFYRIFNSNFSELLFIFNFIGREFLDRGLNHLTPEEVKDLSLYAGRLHLWDEDMATLFQTFIINMILLDDEASKVLLKGVE